MNAPPNWWGGPPGGYPLGPLLGPPTPPSASWIVNVPRGILLAALTVHAAAACLIRGTVVDAATGTPLAGARVLVGPRGFAKPNILRLSDAQGAFCFDRLETGKYELSALRAGYLNYNYGSRSDSAAGIALNVDGVTETPALTLKMTRSASIAGTVTDANGELLENAHITLWRKVWDSSMHRWNSDELSPIVTDDRGSFRFPRLAPGNYYLSAEERDDPGGLDEKGLPVRATGPATYYASTFSFDRATAIPLNPGQDANVALIIPARAEGRHLSVRLAPGLDLGTSQAVHLTAIGGTQQRYSAKLQEDGTASWRDMPPGKYSLDTNLPAARAVAQVDLTDGDVDGLLLSPQPERQLHITVTGDPADLKQLGLQMRDTETGELAGASERTANGKYLLAGLAPGRYWLEPSGKEKKGYLTNLTVDGHAQQPDGLLDLRAGSPTSSEVAFGTRFAQIAGRVEHAEGLATTIVWVDEERSKMEEIGDSVDAEPAGQFQIEKMPPGKYRLFAIEGFDDDLWGSPELAALLRQKSVAVELGEDERKQVILPLITAAEWDQALRKLGM